MPSLPIYTKIESGGRRQKRRLHFILTLALLSLLSILSFVLALGQTRAAPRGLTSRNIRVISHNLRFAGNNSAGFYHNENAWSSVNVKNQASYRGPYSAWQLKKWATLTNGTSTFICLQEAYFQQVRDLVGYLNGGSVPYGGNSNTFHVIAEKPNSQDYGGALGRTDYKSGNPTVDDAGLTWSYLGVGRDDGKSQGEMSPILYKPADWRVITWRTMWLSPKPTEPSYGWGASNRRVATWAIFESNNIEKTRIVVCSAHLDDNYWDQNDSIRSNELALIKGAIDAYVGRSTKIAPTGTYGHPVVIGGDFNANSSAPSIQDFFQGGNNLDVHGYLRYGGQAWGPVNTYTTFGAEWHPDNVDYVWCTPWSGNDGKTKAGMGTGTAYWSMNSISRFGVVPDTEGGVYNSDHDLILADLTLNLT